MSQRYKNIRNIPAGELVQGIAKGNKKAPKTTTEHKYLKDILQLQKKLKEAKARPVIFSPPIVEHSGKPVIFPNTINVIQGQAGSHKSRVAELVCSTLLNRNIELAGFKASSDRDFTVCYVDTERNLTEQLPAALQSIQIKAGYRIDEHPNGFDYITLLDTERGERFEALKEYLDYVREKSLKHIVVVLDVLTDCCKDFNRTDDAMPLIDHLNKAINSFDVTFICIIHENPGSEKARGHLGTELANKASTIMQVGYEKDGSGKDTDLIRVRFVKCRNTKRHEPFYLKYCDTFKGLVLADESEVNELNEQRKTKAAPADVADRIEFYLQEKGIVRAALVELLMKDFDASQRTIEERIKEIIATDTGFNRNGTPCKLQKYKEGQVTIYALTPREIID